MSSRAATSRGRLVLGMAVLVPVVALAAAQASGNGAPTPGWTVPRTAYGHPDLQGIWSNNTATPLERPETLAGKEALTSDELAGLQARLAELREGGQAGNPPADRLVEQLLNDCSPGRPRPAPYVNDLLACRTERALLPPEPPRPPRPRFPPPPSLDSMVRMAARGQAGLQVVLGVRYYNGTGVSQDYAEAARWFLRAAEQGHAGGQFWLGGLYRDGYGIPQDLVSAHIWLDLASRSTGRIHEVAVEHRAAVAALMTCGELIAARRRAREWKPRSVP